MQSKKARMEELARRAGVSVATAYRVVKQRARVSPALEVRVQQAARDLDIAIRRASPRKVLAFLLGNRSMLHHFHSQVLVGAAARCAESDYGVQFFPFHYLATLRWKELPMPRTLQGGNFPDGFVVAGTNSENLLERLAETRRPFAVLGNNMMGQWREDRYDVVWMDLIATSHEITNYLLSLGHRHFWFVGDCRLPWVRQCFEGYCRAMKDAGLEARASDFVLQDERESGYFAMKSLVSRGEPVTAVFAASDSVAHGVYEVLRDLGLRVPEDVSVVGVGDRPEAVALQPALSTVRGFPEQVGRQLAQLVLNRIEQPDLPRQMVVIPAQFIKRDSCRPVAAVSGSVERRERKLARDAPEVAPT